MRGLNLDHLQAFADIVALGSFSAAAARRNLTQPAISLQLRQLENRLGVRLIERVGKRAMPTQAGQTLLQHAGRIEAVVDAALADLAQHASKVIGRVRIGSGATACIYLLPPLLRELRQRFPGLELTVNTGNTDDMLRAVAENRLDLALVTLPPGRAGVTKLGRAFVVEPLLSDEFVAVGPFVPADAGGKAALAWPKAVTPQWLAGQPLVLYESGANTRGLVDAWFGAAGLAPRPAMELGSVEAIKQLVGAGLGLTILPSMALPDKDGNLSQHSLAPRLSRRLALVLRRDKPLQRGLRETVAALRRLA
ncbi:LysR family transcriptional regulator [Ferrovibrio sp.]|uniref:LysR family transcriptional regulator n=1 Tax=Ferrovibrio sp. TaxID=1917215 RepID=UPI001B4BC3D2|nr:LysR family transcriptional regulator [Ferrovibrio sp.]MBP7062897.1 LysR family transcriptional regulator [Ferrovibrio sp.]